MLVFHKHHRIAPSSSAQRTESVSMMGNEVITGVNRDTQAYVQRMRSTIC